VFVWGGGRGVGRDGAGGTYGYGGGAGGGTKNAGARPPMRDVTPLEPEQLPGDGKPEQE